MTNQNIFFDSTDLSIAERLKDQRLLWLSQLGAKDIAEAKANDSGFLFGYEHGRARLLSLTGPYPGISDQPGDRDNLVELQDVLRTLDLHGIKVSTPKTWILEIDTPTPNDLSFPLFLRSPKSSWKRGGDQGRVNSLKELEDESGLLRRAFGWDTPVLAREWLDVAVAGKWMFGSAPREIRTWVIDGEPTAWSFHYLHAVKNPVGFPPSEVELKEIRGMSAKVCSPFKSRLIAADFICDSKGTWHFMEAGPGAAAGTGHELVFKFVASSMVGRDFEFANDCVGGVFP